MSGERRTTKPATAPRSRGLRSEQSPTTKSGQPPGPQDAAALSGGPSSQQGAASRSGVRPGPDVPATDWTEENWQWLNEGEEEDDLASIWGGPPPASDEKPIRRGQIKTGQDYKEWYDDEGRLVAWKRPGDSSWTAAPVSVKKVGPASRTGKPPGVPTDKAMEGGVVYYHRDGSRTYKTGLDQFEETGQTQSERDQQLIHKENESLKRGRAAADAAFVQNQQSVPHVSQETSLSPDCSSRRSLGAIPKHLPTQSAKAPSGASTSSGSVSCKECPWTGKSLRGHLTRTKSPCKDFYNMQHLNEEAHKLKKEQVAKYHEKHKDDLSRYKKKWEQAHSQERSEIRKQQKQQQTQEISQKKLTSPKKEIGRPRTPGPHRCVLCHADFVYKWEIERHMQDYCPSTGGPPKFKCSICENLFKSEFSLTRHMREVHGEEKKYRCDTDNCPATFARNEDLQNHKKAGKHHFEFFCIICKMSLIFPSQAAKNRHYMKLSCHPFTTTCLNIVRQRIRQHKAEYDHCMTETHYDRTSQRDHKCCSFSPCNFHRSIKCCSHHQSKDKCHPWGTKCPSDNINPLASTDWRFKAI